MFKVPERFRVKSGMFGTTQAAGCNGLFMVKLARNQTLKVIASDGAGWEHVSVSRQDRCPVWDEMCAVKELFWDAEDYVVQYHPAAKDYINDHPNCLHLFRPVGQVLPVPPTFLVGVGRKHAGG